MNQAKMCTIIMDGQSPSFDFKGKWTGADAIVVRRLFDRAYLKYVRTIRLDENKKRREQ